MGGTMSKLLDEIKQNQLTARKSGDKVRATLLTTLIGEASPSGNETVADKDVLVVINKFYKNLRDTCKLYADRGVSTEVPEAEMAILLEFMPKQLSEEEITNIATKFIEENNITSMKGIGQVMGHFANNYKGCYDGKEVQQIVKSILGA